MFNLPAKEQHSRGKEPLFFRLTGVHKHMHPGTMIHDKAVSGTLTKGSWVIFFLPAHLFPLFSWRAPCGLRQIVAL